MRIARQAAVVTGGASGLGEACVQALKHRGANVMVWDAKAVLSDTASIQCDVSNANSVESALTQTISAIGIPTILINCAGIAPAQRMTGKLGLMPLESFARVIEVNLLGTFNAMRVIADAMTKIVMVTDVDRGVIINTASIAAYEGQIGQTAYSASKGGIVALTLPAARELAQYGIRVNAIAPGLMATPLLKGMPEEVQANLAATVTYPKRFGAPDEFAALAMHIIENSFLNGEVIRLDGALRMEAK